MTVASGRGRRILLVEDNRGDAGLVIELIAQRRQPGDEVVPVSYTHLDVYKRQA